MTTQPQTQDDAWNAADSAKPRPVEYEDIGQVVTIDPWFCVFAKGAPRGKRPYDETRDLPDQRRVAVSISIRSLSPNVTWLVEQEVTEADKAFHMTQQSYTKLHRTLKSMRNAWVRYVRRSTGETYEGKNGIKDRTAIVFLEVYAGEATARNDAARRFPQWHISANGAPPIEEVDLPDSLPDAAQPAGDSARAFAQTALDAFQKVAQGNTVTLAKLIRTNPLVATYFGEDGTPKDADDDLPF